MKESELAEHFVNYFSEGYEVYKEVPFAGIIDIYAVCGPILTAVEVKARLSFDVIAQAQKNTQCAHFSYVAVPACKSNFSFTVCKMMGIGVLTWDKYGVNEVVKPAFNRKVYKPKLQEYMKQSVAGSQNDRITAFGNTLTNVRAYIKKNGGSAHISDILKNVHYHWSSSSSAKQCLQTWIRKGVIKDIEWNKGILTLKP